MNEMHYLAIDPGERSTGWCKFAKDGSEIELGRITEGAQKFMDWLESLDPIPEVIIYENYRLDPTRNKHFSTLKTSQLIGMIIRYAHTHNIEIHEQANTVLKIGLRYVGFYATYYDSKGKKKKHVDDQISAFAHGAYWLQKRGIRKSRVIRNG